MIELDYKTVKRDVWSKFITIYGGGPSIVREKPEIYSTPVEVNHVPAAARLRSPSPMSSQLKAMKQARREHAVDFGAQADRVVNENAAAHRTKAAIQHSQKAQKLVNSNNND